jgi:hypothetical protein
LSSSLCFSATTIRSLISSASLRLFKKLLKELGKMMWFPIAWIPDIIVTNSFVPTSCNDNVRWMMTEGIHEQTL